MQEERGVPNGIPSTGSPPPRDAQVDQGSMSAMLSQQGSITMMHQSRTAALFGGGAGDAFVEDANGTTKALLENVQTVYLDNISVNDQMERQMRSKMASDEEMQRLREQNKKLTAQHAADEQTRASESAVRAAPACSARSNRPRC